MRGSIPPLPNTPSWRGAHLRRKRKVLSYLPKDYNLVEAHAADGEVFEL
jgi:hypothetical protein